MTEEKVKEMVDKILALMAIKSEVKVEEDKENSTFLVNIEAGEENGLLIGRRGETIASLQFITSILLREELGEGTRVVVNVGDWKEKQEDYLKNLAAETATRAKESGEAQPLYNLTPAQRRVVHLELSQNPDVTTESTGEGDERYLIVKPKV